MIDKFLYARATALVLRSGNASTSHLARKLNIDYQLATALMTQLARDGIVSAPDGKGRRTVLNAANE